MARRSSFSPSGLGGLPRFFGFSMRRIVVTHKTLDKTNYSGTIKATKECIMYRDDDKLYKVEAPNYDAICVICGQKCNNGAARENHARKHQREGRARIVGFGGPAGRRYYTKGSGYSTHSGHASWCEEFPPGASHECSCRAELEKAS